jgi:PhnB protein
MAIQGASGRKGILTPHLVVRDAAQAAEFYQRAFGAVELYRSPLPGGMGLHIHLRIGETLVMVTSETPPDSSDEIYDQVVLRSPESLGGTTMLIELIVDDVDTSYRRAVDAGATPVLPVSDCFWGDRYGWVADPFGHLWALATIVEYLTPEQVEERIREMMAAGSGTKQN